MIHASNVTAHGRAVDRVIYRYFIGTSTFRCRAPIGLHDFLCLFRRQSFLGPLSIFFHRLFNFLVIDRGKPSIEITFFYYTYLYPYIDVAYGVGCYWCILPNTVFRISNSHSSGVILHTHIMENVSLCPI